MVNHGVDSVTFANLVNEADEENIRENIKKKHIWEKK